MGSVDRDVFDPVLLARKLGFTLTDHQAEALRELVTHKGEEGYEGYLYRGALASFWLLARKALGINDDLFELVSMRVLTAWSAKKAEEPNQSQNEAVIRYRHNGEEPMEAAEGVGPVDALFVALTKIRRRLYQQAPEVHLVGFQVRDLDPQAEAAARVAVQIETSDGERTWLTVGVDDNLIIASWIALVDAVTVGVRAKGASPSLLSIE